MVRAIRERTVVGPSGRVVIDRSGLPEGTAAEVIVLVDDQLAANSSVRRPLASYIGAMKGQFASASDADAHLRDLRDKWDRP